MQMIFDLNFDATQHDPKQGEGDFSFPLADYVMEIVSADFKATADSTPENPKGYIAVKSKCINGQYAGQTITDRLNMWNPSEKTVTIAKQQLSAYCHIGGKPRIGQNSELIGIKWIGTLGPQEENPKYSDIKLRKDLAGNTPVFNQPSAPQSTVPQVAAAPPAATQTQTQPVSSPFSNPAATPPTPQGNTAAAPPAGAWNSGPAAPAGGGAPPWANKA